MKTYLCLFFYFAVDFHSYGLSLNKNDSSRRDFLKRNNYLIGLKFGGGLLTEQPPLRITGVGYSVVPEFEYFIFYGLSTSLAVNYTHSKNRSNGAGGEITQRSAYLGAKKYFVYKKRGGFSLNIGFNYGNKRTLNYTDPRLNYNITGSNFSAGLGFLSYPGKVFGRTNNRWSWFVDFSVPFLGHQMFRFLASGIGIKYRLNKID